MSTKDNIVFDNAFAKESIDEKTGRGWLNFTFGKKLPAFVNGTIQESKQARTRIRTNEKGTFVHTNIAGAEIVALAEKIKEHGLEAKAFSFRSELFQNKEDGGYAPIPEHPGVKAGKTWTGKHSLSYGDPYMGV